MKHNMIFEIGRSTNYKETFYRKIKEKNEVHNLVDSNINFETVDFKNSYKEKVTLKQGYVDKKGDFKWDIREVEIVWYPLSSEYTVRQGWNYECRIEKKTV